MKKTIINLTFIAFVSLLLTSCGGDSNSTPQSSDKSSASTESTTPQSSEKSTDCDNFIKDYEAFANSYIKIMKKYKKNPSDTSVLTEYMEIIQKATEMQDNAAKCTDLKDATRLMNIATKMATAAADMY